MTDEEILQRAMRCFWHRGYPTTSVADLVADTGVQRSTLYRTHSGKQALFLASLEHYREFRTGALPSDGSLPEQVRHWMAAALRPYTTGDVPHGCLLVSTAAHYATLEPDVRARVQQHLDGLRAFFAAAVRAARPERDPAKGAAVLFGANTALFLLARTSAPEAELRRILDAALECALG